MLPFDAHNHVHMGPSPPGLALVGGGKDGTSTANLAAISGMAIMSTHPRDYDRVLHLTKSLPAAITSSNKVQIVPCLGVHPWFLHELTQEDWENSQTEKNPKWIQHLEALLTANPNAIVGEIGLDGFHFDPHTEELTSPMEPPANGVGGSAGTPG
jgi:Tat protein secretion system quality control protein TatD with DNase activity